MKRHQDAVFRLSDINFETSRSSISRFLETEESILRVACAGSTMGNDLDRGEPRLALSGHPGDLIPRQYSAIDPDIAHAAMKRIARSGANSQTLLIRNIEW